MTHRIKTLAALALTLALPALASAEPAAFTVDTAHSNAMFRVKHFGISTVTGSFGEWSGTIHFDPENYAASKASATLETASIDTNNEKRDEHLRSDDFFNVEQYPQMTFESTEVSGVTDDGFNLHGNLTIRDVTKPVVLAVQVGGVIDDPWGNTRAAFTANCEINRQDFNVKWDNSLPGGELVVSDNVTIVLEIEGIHETDGES